MAKFFLLVELSGLKKRDLKHKCAVTNVNWNNLTLEYLAKDEQNLLGTTSNYLRSSQGTTRNFRTFQGLYNIIKYKVSDHYKQQFKRLCLGNGGVIFIIGPKLFSQNLQCRPTFYF